MKLILYEKRMLTFPASSHPEGDVTPFSELWSDRLAATELSDLLLSLLYYKFPHPQFGTLLREAVLP